MAAFAPQVELASGTLLDFKSALQEQLARQGRRVAYEITEESGPPHDKTFRVQARVGDEVVGSGNGASKKAAEQAAAAEALGETDGLSGRSGRQSGPGRFPVRSSHDASLPETWRACI